MGFPNQFGSDSIFLPEREAGQDGQTYVPTGEGWLYLAAILDMNTRKIFGWSMRETLHVEIALDALNMAIERQRPPPGLFHHSDRGIQYAAGVY